MVVSIPFYPSGRFWSIPRVYAGAVIAEDLGNCSCYVRKSGLSTGGGFVIKGCILDANCWGVLYDEYRVKRDNEWVMMNEVLRLWGRWADF
jgi:hypothetical protein